LGGFFIKNLPDPNLKLSTQNPLETDGFEFILTRTFTKWVQVNSGGLRVWVGQFGFNGFWV